MGHHPHRSYNAVHGSDAPDTAAAELSFFFSSPALGRCEVGRGTTLGIIKPHLVLDGAAGLALDLVSEHFSITALRLVTLDKAAAAEFYEVYKGVLAIGEFTALVDELTSGPCIAFEVADRDGASASSAEAVVESFRELCGPVDPELARVLRPKSIRAQLGLNKIKNGIHCTDLAEDGELEVGGRLWILYRGFCILFRRCPFLDCHMFESCTCCHFTAD